MWMTNELLFIFSMITVLIMLSITEKTLLDCPLRNSAPLGFATADFKVYRAVIVTFFLVKRYVTSYFS